MGGKGHAANIVKTCKNHPWQVPNEPNYIVSCCCRSGRLPSIGWKIGCHNAMRQTWDRPESKHGIFPHFFQNTLRLETLWVATGASLLQTRRRGGAVAPHSQEVRRFMFSYVFICFPHRTHAPTSPSAGWACAPWLTKSKRGDCRPICTSQCTELKNWWRVALAARCSNQSTFSRQQTAKIVEWTSQLGEWNWPMVSHHHMNVSLPIEFNYDSSDSNYKYWVCIGLVSSKLRCSYPLSIDLHKSCLWVPIERDWINLGFHLQNLVECHLMWI